MAGTIVCYGDSNTYGYDPRSMAGGRYGKSVRWTGILDTETDWRVLNHGVNGRSIPHTLSQLRFACEQVENWSREEAPVWIMVMLGTNDLLQEPRFTAEDAAARMESFLERLAGTDAAGRKAFRLWLVSPPGMRLGAWVEEERLCRESERLGSAYQKIANKLGIRFTDAGKWKIPLLFDGVHFSEEGHKIFAEEILRELRLGRGMSGS
ncbi:MAG TPA: lysophospholipase [Candidatus Blautia faecipullorum]|nr:lysophospholipase [Candidatus Blautia faecipullorum]